MSDSPEQTAAEIPPPPTENEAGKAEIEDKTGLLEKIRDAASGAFQRASARVKARGRGRPKNCPGCGNAETRCICTTVPGEILVGDGVGGMDGAQINQELVTKAVSSIVKSACSGANQILARKIVEKTGDKAFSVAIIADCSPTEDELDSLGLLADICLRRYGVGSQYMPEIGLGCILAGISARYCLAFKTVGDLPQRVGQEKK